MITEYKVTGIFYSLACLQEPKNTIHKVFKGIAQRGKRSMG